MIEFELSVDVLGNTRFAFSPLAEVASSLRLLGTPHVGHLHQPWLRAVRDRLDGVDVELLVAVAPPGRWAPDFLYLPSPGPMTTIEDQLRVLTAMPPEKVHRELATIYANRLPPVAQDLVRQRGQGIQRLVDAIWEYWHAAIQPYWQRMCGVLEDDVSYRATRSLSGGLFELLADIHPEVSLSGSMLMIDKPHHASATYSGAELTLTPSVFVWPQLVVSHSRPDAFELTYAARGVGRVWEGLQREKSEDSPLAALLGRTRSAILTRLTIPMSTTQLSRELGQSPGSVSQHLSILRDSGMLVSWRSGRSVLYRRTPLAESIIAVAAPEHVASGLA